MQFAKKMNYVLIAMWTLTILAWTGTHCAAQTPVVADYVKEITINRGIEHHSATDPCAVMHCFSVAIKSKPVNTISVTTPWQESRQAPTTWTSQPYYDEQVDMSGTYSINIYPAEADLYMIIFKWKFPDNFLWSMIDQGATAIGIDFAQNLWNTNITFYNSSSPSHSSVVPSERPLAIFPVANQTDVPDDLVFQWNSWQQWTDTNTINCQLEDPATHQILQQIQQNVFAVNWTPAQPLQTQTSYLWHLQFASLFIDTQNSIPISALSYRSHVIPFVTNGGTQPPSLTLDASLPQAPFQAGQVVPITWTTIGAVDDVQFDYSLDEGYTWTEPIPNNTGNTGAYNWLVPRTLAYSCLIRVSDINNPDISDTQQIYINTAFPDWAYAQPIQIDNPGGPLTHYPILVNVNTERLILQGKLNDDGSDIRFANADQSAMLSYWIEPPDTISKKINGLGELINPLEEIYSGVNSPNTRIWVNVPNIPAGQSTIYFYYGNLDAISNSDGQATFDFFDEFDTETIDINKWTPIGDSAGYIITQVDSFLSILGTSDTWQRPGFQSLTIYPTSQNFAVTWDVNLIENTLKSETKFTVSGASNSIGHMQRQEASCAWGAGTANWIGANMNHECGVFSPGQHRLQFINTQNKQQVIDNDTEKAVNEDNQTLGDNIKLLFSAGAAGGNVAMATDRVFVRPFTDPEPTNAGFLAQIFHVPADYPTIQAAIDAAEFGDIVEVADGTYTGDGNRDIYFNGKSITVRSENGPSNCVIDCANSQGPLARHIGFYFANEESNDAVLDGFTIINGFSDTGAIHCSAGSPIIKNCILLDSLGDFGGALSSVNGSEPTLLNCVISGNLATYGGAIYVGPYSSVNLLNCTLADNNANWGGGIFCEENGMASINNSILYGNSAYRGNELALHRYDSYEANPYIEDCDITGGLESIFICTDPCFTENGIDPETNGDFVDWGAANIDADPLFANPRHWEDEQWVPGDYHIDQSSPCADAGQPEAISYFNLTTDIDGNPRIDNGRPDMGAYETIIQPAEIYQLDAYVVGGHGSVNPTNDIYDAETVVTLIAQPETGYQVKAWSGTDNAPAYGSTTETATMNRNRTVTVTFEPTETKPDLVITDISIPRPYVKYLDPNWTTVEFAIKNLGPANIEDQALLAQIVNITLDGQPFTYSGFFDIYYTPPMSPASIVTHQFAVGHDADWPIGKYRFQIEIDYRNLIDEVNEDNNLSDFITFEVVEDLYPLTTTTQGSGSVINANPIPDNLYPSEMTLQLTAQPAQNWQFLQWTGDIESTENPLTVLMDSPKNIIAVFEQTGPNQYNLNATVIGGNGTVSPTGGTYDEDTQITLTAVPDPGYQVKAWTGADNTPAPLSTTNTATMNSNRNVTVEFEPIPLPTYTLTASVIGGHGTVNPAGGTYEQGTPVSLTVTPSNNYRVVRWFGADSAAPGSTTNTVTMTSDKVVTVECERLTGAVAVSIIPQLAITEGAQWLLAGQTYQSGQTASNIPVGSHSVTFTPILGWTSPQDLTVVVDPDQTTQASAAYIQAKAQEPVTGALRVVIAGANNTAAWRPVGTTEWRNSGYTQTGLFPGSYEIEFQNVSGYQTPADQTTTIQAGQTAVTYGVYSQTGQQEPQFGSLTVAIQPQQLADQAHWRITGGQWQTSGAVIDSLTVGTYTIEFETVDSENWLKPADTQTLVCANTLTNAQGLYTYLPHTVYVANSGNDIQGNGSQQHPFATIQKAIGRVIKNGTVIVLPGTYQGKGNVNLNFKGKPLTLRSQDGPDTCIIDCQANENRQRRGLIFQSGETNLAIVDGLTITNAYATVGAGIFCENNSNPTIRNCVVTNNTSQYSGAGIRCNDSSPTINGCTIALNHALMTGGGVFCDNISNPIIKNSNIINNSSQGCGGGIYCNTDSRPTLENCLIAGNTANSCGGGIYNASGSKATINLCTITANTANVGSAVRCYNADPVFTNSIIWANTTVHSTDQIDNYMSNPSFAYCDIQDSDGSWPEQFGTNNGNNFDLDPLFINTDSENGDLDYHLQTASPAIDAGNPITACGEPYPNGQQVNLGAYGNTAQAAITVDTDGDGINDPQETRWALNINNIDTDNDGLTDYQETALDGNPDTYNPYNQNTQTGAELNAANPDTDNDGIGDYDEVGYNGNLADYLPYSPQNTDGTDLNALAADTDGDGMNDPWELKYPPLNPINPNDAELDSDDDTYSNLKECQANTNPLDPTSTPPAFLYTFEIAQLQYADGTAINDGALTLGINLMAEKTMTALTLTFPDGHNTALPVRNPANYNQADFFSQTQIPLTDIEAGFPAGNYTLTVTFDDETTEATTFEHYYSVYPEFPIAVQPTDNQIGVDPTQPISWNNNISWLTITDTDAATTVLTTAIDPQTTSFTPPDDTLDENREYLLQLKNSDSLAPYLASVTLTHFDTYAGSTVIYVDQIAQGQNNGTSWAHAYTNLQTALAAAQPGAEIWVATGTYLPGAQTADTFLIDSRLYLYGGFNGAESVREQRDDQTNTTVLSGNLANDLNAKHVVTFIDGADRAILDGFVITGGNANGNDTCNECIHDDPEDYGGGIYCENASPLVRRCLITANQATYGGGLYCYDNSDATFSQCTIADNAALHGGAAVFAQSQPKLINCLIAGNQADDAGAIFASYGSATLTNCTVVENWAQFYGGALLGWQTALVINNSIFWDNVADDGEQIALGSNTHLATAYSDIQGGSDDIYREQGCTLTWDNSNINRMPRFAQRGDITDGVWLPGDYQLRDASPNIDAGNNASINAETIDILGNPRLFNENLVDMGAYEFQGYQFLPSVSPLTLKTFTVQASATQGYGSIILSGAFNDDTEFGDTPDNFYVHIGPFERSIDVLRDGVHQSGNRYSYVHRSNDGNLFLFRADLNTKTFSLIAHNIFLGGMTAPVTVEIMVGDNFHGLIDADESIINGPTRPIPIKLLSGYTDALTVNRATFNAGTQPARDSLIVQGAIAARDNGFDISTDDVTFTWGDFAVTLPAETFSRVGQTRNFRFTKPRGSTLPVTSANIDLDKCLFNLNIRNTDIGNQGDTVNVTIQFGQFNQTATIQP